VIVMPASQLVHVSLEPGEIPAASFAASCATWRSAWRATGSRLLAFNILYWNGDITIIDFPAVG